MLVISEPAGLARTEPAVGLLQDHSLTLVELGVLDVFCQASIALGSMQQMHKRARSFSAFSMLRDVSLKGRKGDVVCRRR